VRWKGTRPTSTSCTLEKPLVTTKASLRSSWLSKSRKGKFARSRSVGTSGRSTAQAHALARELHFKNTSFSSNENDHVAARCAQHALRILRCAHLLRNFPLGRLIDRRGVRISSAFRADAPDYIPGETHPAPVVASAGWPPAAGPPPPSACDASAHACRSAPDVLPAMRSGTIPNLIHHTASRDNRPPRAMQRALRYRDGWPDDPTRRTFRWLNSLSVCCRCLGGGETTRRVQHRKRSARQCRSSATVRKPVCIARGGRGSRLAVWWIKLGIVPERSRQGHPEAERRHERCIAR